MKNPRPTPPSDAPPGTVWFGGSIGWFSVSLHVNADDLDPEIISTLLSVNPTSSQVKGVPLLRENGAVKRIPKYGQWTICIKSKDTDEWDIEEVIRTLFARLPSDLDKWRKVAAIGSIRLSMGLSLETSNQGFSFAPDLVVILSERSVQLEFDIYSKEFGTPH